MACSRPTATSEQPAAREKLVDTTPELPNGYPWARLAVPKRTVTPLETTLDGTLERLGVRSVRAFMAEPPRVMLVVYEFSSQAALLSAKDEILKLRPPGGTLEVAAPPPFYAKAASTGPWLLVAGFPAEKPPASTSEALRDEYLQAWSGQE